MVFHIFILFGVMFAAGVLGGLINYLFNKGKSEDAAVMKSIVIGTGASLLVPLFLNMISSDLITSSRSDPYKIFVIAGYCLIASISSTAFIGRMSKSVISEIDKANKKVKELEGNFQELKGEHSDAITELQSVRGAVDPLMAKGTEPEYSEEKTLNGDNTLSLDDNEKKVLTALSDCQYTYRSIEGLAKDTNLDKASLNKVIEKLITEGLAASTNRPEGTRVHITHKGRKLVFSWQHANGKS